MSSDRPRAEPRLETVRLELTSLMPSDAEDLFAVLDDPALGRFTGDPPPADAAALRDRIERWAAGPSHGGERWLNWLVRRREGRVAVGHLQATVHGDEAEIAWVIGTSFQRRGFATEAASAVAGWLRDDPAVAVIRCAIHPDHVASQTVAARIGLRPTRERSGGEVIWSDAPG